jgi:hypothetical protein
MNNQPSCSRKILQERKRHRRAEFGSAGIGGCHRGLHNEEHRNAGNDEFEAKPGLARKAFVALLGDLEIVVVKPDRAEAERHQQRGHHIDA